MSRLRLTATQALGVVLLLIWLGVSLPLALGQRTFFFRDVLSIHLPFKAFGAQQLKEGRIPAFNPSWALGQPYGGNPNALPFYPDNLLFVVLPFWVAFNLHFVLHWLLAFLTMRALAREMGQSDDGALLTALTYAGGGWLLSSLSFYNLVTVAAWWPLALWGAARGGRRGIGVAGLAIGLAILGGEPWTVVLGFVPLLIVAYERHGWRLGLMVTATAGAIAALLALPQIVATLRIFDFTVRGGYGVRPFDPSIYSFHPLRLFELLIPFPFGWPEELGIGGFWTGAIVPREPFFYTIHLGVVGLWLAWLGRGAARKWTLLAVAGLLLAWMGRVTPQLFLDLTGGSFRYAEKFLFWFALAAPLLAGAGFERLRDSRSLRLRSAWLLGAFCIVVGGTILLFRPAFLSGVENSLEKNPHISGPIELAEALLGVEFLIRLWLIALFLGGVLLIAAGVAARRRLLPWIVGLQVIGLFQLFPLVRSLPLEPLKEPSPWLEIVGNRAAVANNIFTRPTWYERPGYDLRHASWTEAQRVRVEFLDHSFGTLQGLSYPLAADVEGIYSPLYSEVPFRLPTLEWPMRLNWLRTLGVEYLVAPENPGLEGLEPIASVERFGVETTLFRVLAPAPEAWWPEATRVESVAEAAFELVATAPDPVATVVVPNPVPHTPGGEVRVLESEPDRMVFEVSGRGGLIVVRRAFQRLFTASTGNRELVILPANVCMLGIVVPPGAHTIVLHVSHRAEVAAALVALACLLATLSLLRR